MKNKSYGIKPSFLVRTLKPALSLLFVSVLLNITNRFNTMARLIPMSTADTKYKKLEKDWKPVISMQEVVPKYLSREDHHISSC